MPETAVTEEPQTPPAGEGTPEPEATIVEAPVEDPTEEEDEEEDPTDLKAAVEFWRNKAKKNGAEARNQRQAKKDLEAQLTPLQQAAKDKKLADMTELDRANTLLEELREANKKLQRDNGLAAVTARYELPERVLSKIEGTTAAELLASADEWAKDLGIERKDKTPRRTKVAPAELNGGLDPSRGTTASISEQIANAQSAGDWVLAGRLKGLQLFELAKK